MSKIMVNSIAIIVAWHKKLSYQFTSLYLRPIQVGAATSNTDLGILKDNTGDNISAKNDNYCELTAIYWAWKNLNADYYGLMHYRRYLVIHNQFSWRVKRVLYYIGRRFYLNPIIRLLKMHKLFQIEVDVPTADKLIQETNDNLPSLLSQYDLLLPKREFFRISVYEQYKITHIESHLQDILKIIQEKYPVIYGYMIVELNKKYTYCTNMFVMKKEYFHEYASFIFDVLFELEKRIVIPHDEYQKRVFGFLSERLMAPFVQYLIAEKNIKRKELNIIFINGMN
jgi:hypothetical protein